MTAAMVEKEGFAALVLRLRAEGISDIDLLTAVEQTPRSLFVPPQFADKAYSSRSIPIECGSFMEGVDFAVRLLDRLKVKPGHRVLEIGTGSGFMTGVLSRLAERVLSIDRYRTLTENAHARMEKLQRLNVVIRQGDGRSGVPGEGTFDRIICTAAFKEAPRFYAEQLVSGGTMIAPLMQENGTCRMVQLGKVGSRFEREDLFEAPYLPFVENIASFL